jgi:hypothetical protein
MEEKLKQIKKLLVLLVFSIGSCTAPEAPEIDCNCGTVTNSTTITNYGNVYSTFKIKNNCTGIETNLSRNERINIGQIICNY